jgi:PhnB protein
MLKQASTVDRIPAGYASITPHLIVVDVAVAVDFYERAFAAVVWKKRGDSKGRLLHAELRVGDSVLMVAQESPALGSRAPSGSGGRSVSLHMFVDQVDASFKRAIDAGATVEIPVADMFWGDRYGKLRDPFGHEWSMASRIADLTDEQFQEAARRQAARP